MSARSPQQPVDPEALAKLLSDVERDLSRQARERLELGTGGEAWFALVEEAVV
jgi:hypothetical protein